MFRLFLIVIIITVNFMGCQSEKKTDVQSVDSLKTESDFHGWFKGKTEFSFKTITQTNGEMNGQKIESLVTNSFVVHNGMEAVQETENVITDGVVSPEKVKIYITSKDVNYAINPLTKKYYTEPGDKKADNFIKVWIWTRKTAETYENLIDSGCQKDSLIVDGENLECLTVNGVNFIYDTEKRLRQYKGTASGMSTTIDFTDYLSSETDTTIFAIIGRLESEGFQRVENITEL